MSLLEDLFNFVFQKRSLAQKEQQSQAIKAFILEPILTPSGLVDDPTHGVDAIIIDPNSGIDHSLDFPPDAYPGLDHAPDVDLHLSTEAILPEHIELLPFIHDPEPAIPSVDDLFNSGIFTVGASGKVSIDYLFDGGGYQGQLAIFNLKDMEGFDLNTETGLADFIHEAAHRALSNSDLGHVVIADATEGAKFSGLMPSEWENHNFGEYQGVKTFDMQAGDRFAVMLVPNGTVAQVLDGNQDADIRPLFSLHTVNPNEAFHAGQIADVTGDGNTFVLEDLRTDHYTDRDYNDIIFQVRGATGTAVHLDEVINPELDWRTTDMGHALIEYAKPFVDDYSLSLPPSLDVPASHQPLIGVIDTGFSANNPDLDYSHIALGHDYVDGDNNPLLASGEGNEHGTHILGIIGATQNNGEGIDGINDQAPLWVGRATGSGHWADSLVEFVNHAKESGQPHAVVNLSFDLTQINFDGSETTRYEFTPAEYAALEYARQNHVLIVAAAGNEGGVMSALGAASHQFDNIITVGAAEKVNFGVPPALGFDRADYSNFGDSLDILADGGTIDSPEISLTGDGLGTMAGTSVATAKVTGAVSQVWAANPDLSYRQVIEILKSTATDLQTPNVDAETGLGLLNIAAAVYLAKATNGEDWVTSPLPIPETWEGEGLVLPTERAAATEFMGKYYEWESYTIKAGDTLGAIAYSRMGSSSSAYVNFIAQKNGISNPNLIFVNQKILIPKLVANTSPPSTPPSSPVSVTNWQAAIDAAYRNSPVNLGAPLSDYLDASRSPNGTTGKYRKYQNGTIHWSQKYGAVPIWYDLQREYNEYSSPSGSAGWLGFPTKQEYSWNGGMRTNFENGYIFWNGQRAKAYRFWEPPYQENTSGSEWRSTFFNWDRNQSQPPVNFYENFDNMIASLNLGSNRRSDGKNGINVDWGAGSPKNNPRVPSDFFAVRSYTSAYFEKGKTYKVRVRADDGFQLLAKHQNLPETDPNKWVYITPKDRWQQAYGAYQEIQFTVPNSGWYDFHFHHYEGGGDARIDLTWEEVNNSYRSNIESVLKTFFSNSANTKGENWSGKNITEMWDRISGESAQFPNGNYSSGDSWTVKMPNDVYAVYQDLASTIFGGSTPAVNTGYAYDYGYYSNKAGYGAHSALDIQASSGTVIRSSVKGKVVKTVNDGSNGWWVAVDELDSNNQKVGRRWWYGHLQSPSVSVGNIITAGQTISKTDGHNHLHLTVVNTSSDTVSYNEVLNGKNQGSYALDVQDVLGRTISPLQAYWNSRNSIKQ